MEMWTLRDRNFIVTGGTKGIGRATVEALLKHGATVLLCARTPDDVADTVATLRETESAASSPKVHGVACDVSKEDGRDRLVETADGLFGGELHGLINNVGVNVRRPVHEQTPEEYRAMMDANVDAVYFLCRRSLPLLKKAAATGGDATVVNVSSAAGVRSSGTGAAYGMGKAAVVHLTKILACEWASLRIRVNAVAPWMTMTPMLEEAVKKNPSQLDKVKEWTPMGRLSTVQEAAAPIVFLSMPCSGFVTGQCLTVDGGLTAQGFQGPCVE